MYVKSSLSLPSSVSFSNLIFFKVLLIQVASVGIYSVANIEKKCEIVHKVKIMLISHLVWYCASMFYHIVVLYQATLIL